MTKNGTDRIFSFPLDPKGEDAKYKSIHVWDYLLFLCIELGLKQNSLYREKTLLNFSKIPTKM